MQKKSKNFQFLKKIFFARNNLKRLKICSQHHLCSPRQISGRYLSKKKLVIFQEICDPGYAKKVKKFPIFGKNFFSLETTLNALKIFLQHHLCTPRQISGRYLSKKKLFILQEICYPGYAKKSKNFISLETTLNALKFVRNTICVVHDKFPVGISQKRSCSFFKKSVTPDMQKSQKISNFPKKFFARNNLKCLKIRSQHHLCSPRQISGRYLAKK